MCDGQELRAALAEVERLKLFADSVERSGDVAAERDDWKDRWRAADEKASEQFKRAEAAEQEVAKLEAVALEWREKCRRWREKCGRRDLVIDGKNNTIANLHNDVGTLTQRVNRLTEALRKHKAVTQAFGKSKRLQHGVGCLAPHAPDGVKRACTCGLHELVDAWCAALDSDTTGKP